MDLRYIINASEKLNSCTSADDCIAEVSKAIDTNMYNAIFVKNGKWFICKTDQSEFLAKNNITQNVS